MDKLLLDLSIDVQNDNRTSIDARAVIKKLRDHINKLEDDREERINDWMRLLTASEDRVAELEAFVKHDYISMKNWQEEKTTLQARIVELEKELDDARNQVVFVP